MRLTPRLHALTEHIPLGCHLADVGSDHAYFSSWLVLQEQVSSVVAIEVAEGPYQASQRTVRALGLQERIDVRKGSGLTPLLPGEVDTVVMAGMGGDLMRSILQEGSEVLTGVGRLILQPNAGVSGLRKWLFHHAWRLRDEAIVVDAGRLYEVLVAEPGEGDEPYRRSAELWRQIAPDLAMSREILFWLGPLLLVKGGRLFTLWLEQEMIHCQQILDRMAGRGAGQAALLRQQQLQERMNVLRRVIQCLPTSGQLSN